MEPTHPPVPDDASPERLEDEENMRYPEHANPDEARQRVGLDREDESGNARSGAE